MSLSLKGQPLAQRIQQHVMTEVTKWKHRGHAPKVVTLLVEGDPASMYYARAKKRSASKLGIEFECLVFPRHVQETQLVETIWSLNEQPDVHGIMLELPLPKHISVDRVTAEISPLKDVDGLTHTNYDINHSERIYPATPTACVRLLEFYGYSLSGKHVALVGCGKTVGYPLFHLLLRKNATVTVCHVGTKNLRSHLQQAEIAFVAVGKAGLITSDMVHPDLVIVDAGINETRDHKIVGDVAPAVADCVAALSPTPGGVGPVTTMQLFDNLLNAMEFQWMKSQQTPYVSAVR